MNCEVFRRHLDAYVDGEVDPATLIEFERHESECAICQEQLAFEHAFRRHLTDSLSGVKAPPGLREKVRASLADLDEVEPRVERRSPAGLQVIPLKARYAVPLAAAAAAMLAYSGTFSGGGDGSALTRASTVPILEDVVRLHSSELPPDVPGSRPQQVRSYFQNKVEFPVRPATFDRVDARFLGARLSSVRDRRAAALFYDVKGHRVTVVVFDEPEPLERHALRVRMGDREVYYQQVRGYTVPMRRHAGLTYAFTGDLDRETLFKLAASARVPN